MKCFLKVLLALFILFVVACVVAYVVGNNTPVAAQKRAKKHAEQARIYCESHGMRTDYCIFVDFSIHSGRNRFYIWDFKKERIVYGCVCEHGKGGKSTYFKADFSNKPNSHCTSLGRCRVAPTMDHLYRNKRIPSYRLNGLDTTNSNIHARGIVIHPSALGKPFWPFPSPWRTRGCFGISRIGFSKLKGYMQQSNKPMLLWAYN